MKYIRRKTVTDYAADKIVSITIGAGGGTDTDTLTGIPNTPDTALEVELDDGSVVVLLGYLRK